MLSLGRAKLNWFSRFSDQSGQAVTLLVALLCAGLAVLLLRPEASAATYYVSGIHGNDSNTNSSSTPWKTLAKVNAISGSFAAGDTILFERGGRYAGNLGWQTQNITLDAYGDGALPVIHGYQAVTAWASAGTNLWRAPVSASDVTTVMVNGVSQPLGRYPKTGCLLVDAGVSNTGIIDNTLAADAPGDWTGGQCVVRVSWSSVDPMRIASLTSTQINFTGNTAPYSPAAGYGYFLQNHPLACTQSGEWAFCNGNVYLYSATDPTSSDVEISSLSEGYIVVGMLNTVFRNLRFEGFSSCALDIGNGSSGLTVQNCEFAYMNNGINLNGCLNVSLSQNSFANIYNNAVNAANQSSGSAAMTGNTFSHIGDVTGRAGRDDDAGIGVFITAAPYTVTGNQFDSIGLNAVAVYSAAGVDIENNFITNACLNKQNGGGIFFWSTGTTALAQRVVRKNIIGNVSGSGWGMPAGVTVPWVFGIFLSTNSNDVLVDGNTVFNSLGGMALYDANSIVAHANTFYNCAESMYLANDAGNPTRDCTLQKNLCVNLATAAPDQNTFTLGINYTGGGTIPTANAWDANYYWTPFVDAASVYVTPSSPANMFTVAQWRGVAGQDAHSVEEPLAYSAALGFSRSEFVFFDYAAGSGKTDTLTNGYLDADSHWTAAGVLTIAPYSSRVLVRANSTPPTATVNPALAAGVKDYNSVLAYPNPAKATGHFAFDLEKPGQITVDVYNVAGRKIATLQNNFSQAGAAQIDWDSHTLPAGVYYCKAVLHAADGSTRTYPKFKVAIFR